MLISTIPEHRIRIERIKLQNFKGVSSGAIEFNCFKNPVEKEIQADILGLYGQNGSGKTTLLEALHVVKLAMMGERIPYKKFGGLIAQGADYARIEVQFQVKDLEGFIYHVEYAFSLGRVTISSTKQETQKRNNRGVSKLVPVISAGAGVLAFLNPIAAATSLISAAAISTATIGGAAGLIGAGLKTNQLLKSSEEMKNSANVIDSEEKMIVFDETLSLSGMFNGNMIRFGPVFDASSKDIAFLPKARHKSFFPNKTATTLKELQRHKGQALLDSRSFIFSDEVSMLLEDQMTEQNSMTEYAELLIELKEFACQSLRVLDSRSIGMKGDDRILLYTANRGVGIRRSDSSAFLDDTGLQTLQIALESLNIVLKQLIPGLTLEAVRQVDIDLNRNERIHQAGTKVVIYSVRNNVRIPLAEESAGILHLISALGLISYAFANEGVTVAIDEIDAGVYEYLLGELLLIFEESGCGQLIFTCHNLRPLEVLNKKFVRFTTTNPENRYLRPKNIRHENNLRKVYITEVDAGEQEELYASSKHGRIAAALQKAGEIIGKE